MLDTDVVLAKLASIRRCLDRIRNVTGKDPGRLQDLDVQEIVVLNLQRAVQAAIGLAAHVTAANDWGLPRTLAETFTILETHGLIGSDLARNMRSLVGFRNVAVHEYESLDLTILKAIVIGHLEDFEDFSKAIVRLLPDAGDAPPDPRTDAR